MADEAFWEQFWSESVQSVQDVFTLIPAAEIRALREESPSNLATLCYKAVEKLVRAAETSCTLQKEQHVGRFAIKSSFMHRKHIIMNFFSFSTVLNCVRLLTRLMPYIFEDPDWRGFFWSSLPEQCNEEDSEVSLRITLHVAGVQAVVIHFHDVFVKGRKFTSGSVLDKCALCKIAFIQT